MAQYVEYHARSALAVLAVDIVWDGLSHHAKDLLRRCIVATGEQSANCGDRGKQQPPDNPSVIQDEAEGKRYSAWLHDLACGATPSKVAIESAVSCDVAVQGGRLLPLSRTDYLIVGGTGADGAWLEEVRHSHVADSDPASANARHPLELPDHSRLHGAAQLRPLSGPVWLRLEATRARAGGVQQVRGREIRGAWRPLEAAAACVYGSHVFVHGGASPTGEATNIMRVLRLQPDPHGPAGSLELAAGAAAGAALGGPQAQLVMQEEGSGAEEEAGAGGAGGGGPGSPCAPPSPRYGHHMAVDAEGARVWLFGGRVCRAPERPRVEGLLDLAPGPPPAAVEVAADPQPCCYWAQLPPLSPSPVGAAGASREAGDAGLEEGGEGSGSGAAGGSSGGGGGGQAEVRSVRWRRLLLQPAPRSSSSSSRSAGYPPLPYPQHTAAIAIWGGHMFLLSSAPMQPAGSNSRNGGRPLPPPPGPSRRWLLHRVDLTSGLCTPLLPAPDSAAASPPPFHAGAVAMADDTLPYFYVYGAWERGSGAAALGGGTFVPTLHRVELLRGAAGEGEGVRWEEVGCVDERRWHPVRSPAGAVSCGTVVLAGGLQDVRSGVEARVQRAAPVVVRRSRAATTADAATCPHPDEVALARCRRELAVRLRRGLGGREVRFAHPEGGRPCVVLAAALSLFSPLFDDFFETLDDDADDEGDAEAAAGGGKRGVGGGGLTLPGHDPRAVAAAAAWVMGNTCVEPGWGMSFVEQLFRVAHCWGVAPLQRECVRLLQRCCSALPPQQLPAALELGRDMQRLPGVAAGGELVGRLRRRLQRAAESGEGVHPGNMAEVMESAQAAAAGGGDPGDCQLLVALQGACVAAAERHLASGKVEAGRDVALFSSRFQLRPLLQGCMGWWRKRLVARLTGDGRTLPLLAELVRGLQELDTQAEDHPSGQQPGSSSRSVFDSAGPAAKRAKRCSQGSLAGAEVGRHAEGGSGMACGGSTGGGNGGGGHSSAGGGGGSWVIAVSQGPVPLSLRLQRYLWWELLRVVNPNSALPVLQAFSRPPAAAAAAVQEEGEEQQPYELLPEFVRRALYGKIAELPLDKQQQLPRTFYRCGHCDCEGLSEARRARRALLFTAAAGAPQCPPAAEVPELRDGRALWEECQRWREG